MCGIAGYWQKSAIGDRDHKIIKQMLDIIEHRGPDSQGSYFDKDAGLMMGHARLSIIDLNTGDQPLFSDDRKKVLTANGEFYDYKRIRAELMTEGVRFNTKSDSEIAIKLYERDGLSFVQHLRGEFAFSLFDKANEQLILVRDRFGIRPMFYHVKDNNIYYGSEVKALLEHPDIPRQFNSQAILNQLMQTMVPGTSLFEGIHAVKPGYMLIVKRRHGKLEIKEHCYWDADFPTELPEDISDDEWVNRVRSKLIESVTLRLEADVPVGCYLSGGIDSCSILGLATGAQQSPVKAFTISFDSDEYDEASIAKTMAESMNADQEVLKISSNELYGNSFIKTMWHSERTFYNTLGVAKWHMSKRVHECNYKVVVTGEGSDELFAGYPFFKKDLFLHATNQNEASEYQRILDENNKIFKGAILSDELKSHSAFEDLVGFTPSWIQPWMITLDIARPLLNEDLAREIKDYDPIQAIADTLKKDKLEGRHPLNKVQYTWIKTMLEGQILNWGGDRVDMANSMESRPPFLDHHLAELAFQLPIHTKVKGNVEKWVLREAMKGILPEILYKREKFAFMAPPAHTESKKQGQLNQLLEHYLSAEKIDKAQLLDSKKVAGFLSDYRNDNNPTSLIRKDALINHLLGVQILHDLFIEKNEIPSQFSE